ncbi:MAG: hypothetical protein IKN38_09115 [Clostridia bacterium]|nr:hypothetical protein [Clostridia bacterium]
MNVVYKEKWENDKKKYFAIIMALMTVLFLVSCDSNTAALNASGQVLSGAILAGDDSALAGTN